MKFTQSLFDYHIANDYLSIKKSKISKSIKKLEKKIENEYFIFVQSLSVNIPDPLDINEFINKKYSIKCNSLDKSIVEINAAYYNILNHDVKRTNKKGKSKNTELYFYSKKIIDSYRTGILSIDIEKLSFFNKFIKRKTPMNEYESHSYSLTMKTMRKTSMIKHHYEYSDDNMDKYNYPKEELTPDFKDFSKKLCVSRQNALISKDLLDKRVSVNNIIVNQNKELKKLEIELNSITEMINCFENVKIENSMYIPNNIYSKFISPLVNLTSDLKNELSNDINKKIFYNAIVAFNFKINIADYYVVEEEDYQDYLIKSIPSFFLKASNFQLQYSGLHTAFIDFTFFLLEDKKYFNRISQSLVHIKDQCIIDYINVLQKVKCF
jgi:hypothetical protein